MSREEPSDTPGDPAGPVPRTDSGPEAALFQVSPARFVWAYTRELFASGRRWFLFLGPLMLVVTAWLLGLTLAPNGAHQSYFEASAQIIPILLLALAVETRFLRIPRPSELPDRHVSSLDPAVLNRVMKRAIPSQHHPEWERQFRKGLDTETGAKMMRWAKVLGAIGVVRRLLTAGSAAALVVVSLVVAEWECLQALAVMGSDDSRDPVLVSGGILAGLAGVGLMALLGPPLGRAIENTARVEDAEQGSQGHSTGD